ARIGQQYQKLSGSLTVTFRGEERTLAQMGPYLEEPDRALRREAWESITRRRLMERDEFDRQFDELFKLRHQIALNAGFTNYRDFAFARSRFDYTPADCDAFHEAIASEVVPRLKQRQAERRSLLGLPALRPWDLALDPLGRPPLRPFDDVQRLVDGSRTVFSRLDPELESQFQELNRR